jgi:hypothetical protein
MSAIKLETHHRDTERTEEAQRIKSLILRASSVSSVSLWCMLLAIKLN